ncbi:MAG: hypothetical protein ACM3X7_12300 [Solirubrobacterales bacterium]
MKKVSLLILVLLIAFMFSGCGKHNSAFKSSNSNPPASSASISKSQQNNSSSMEEVNNSMGKLDSALNNSVNTKELNDTETLINNIN